MISNENLSVEYLEKKVYDQKQLIEISKALNSTLDYKYLIDAILNICLAQMHTLNAAIFLSPDLESDFLRLDRGFKGFDITEKDFKFNISLSSHFAEYLEKHPRAFTSKDLFKNKALVKSKELAFFKNLGAEVIVPLTAKGKLNGLLVLGEKMTFSEFPEDELEFMTSLAGLAGIAVENTRLYELATNDIMTGVKVHHYFQSKLKEEITRAKKKGQSLSLIFIDVDHFKSFNDTYGHQIGDIVLVEVAAVITHESRKNDIVARYGGEEFCVVLPGIGEDAACVIAERIRKAVEKKRISHPENKKLLKTTISLGVTELAKTDKSNKDLIRRADKALYQAKNEGRNKTVCFKSHSKK